MHILDIVNTFSEKILIFQIFFIIILIKVGVMKWKKI